ncbi:MAG: flagellar FlbD family protein [Oscillospiraceae bacterium]
MIVLTKLNDQKFVLNHHMVETIQENPDTTIKLSNGNVYIVKEPLEIVLQMIYKYEKGIHA